MRFFISKENYGKARSIQSWNLGLRMERNLRVFLYGAVVQVAYVYLSIKDYLDVGPYKGPTYRYVSSGEQ
jgi:hypothetical protein